MYTPYLDPQYNPYPKAVLIGTAILFILTSIIVVALRFYSRHLIKAPLGLDDWITIPSMLICMGLSVNQIIATTVGGLGSHQKLVDGQLAHTHQLEVYEKTKYTYQVLGTIGLWVVKLSVLFFYRRIFTVPAFRLISSIFIGITLAWGLGFTFAGIFQCTPVSTLWDKFEVEYGSSCVTVQPFYLAFGVSDLILDVIIFTLPMPYVYKLQMPLRQRLAVGGIFFLGSIVIAIGITRVVIFEQVIVFTSLEPYTYFYDITWYTAGTLLWHLVENAVALVGCCLPTFRPLFKNILPNKSSTVGSKFPSASTDITKGTNLSSQSRYYQQHDEEWPMTHVQGGFEGDRGHVSNDLTSEFPQGKIVVQRELHRMTSVV